MPTVYLSKELYDKIVRMGYDVKEFVDSAVRREVKRIEEGRNEP